MDPVERYVRDLRSVRFTGSAVAETSYYPALSLLLNEIGKTLKPKVQCVIHTRNRGAGIPDGGLFTADQIQRGEEPDLLHGMPPSRGVIEAKPSNADLLAVANSDQVRRYLGRYGQVLVTNFWDFLLVGRTPDGDLTLLERYRLAESESAFWTASSRPRALATVQGERFLEFLKRVMLHMAPLASP